MPFQPTHVHALAAAVALAAGGSSSMFASAVSVSTCAELAALPTSSMTENVHVFLDNTPAIECDTVTTVHVDGPYQFDVTSDEQSMKFTNVRFEISGGAEFTFDLANNEFEGTATFTGIADQGSDGGVFYVESGSSATFEVPMAFEDNSVSAGYSGGAVYAGGEVEFQYDASFTGNQALRGGDDDAGSGGAIAVGPEGDVLFSDVTIFTENVANSGGRGGAMENLGSVVFEKASYFTNNEAKENGDELGGLGGALYAGSGSTTSFERRTIMNLNEGSNGGAMYNLGSITLESAGFLRGNKALGTDRADGGHIYSSGSFSIVGRVNFREGFARRDGGAIYIASGGSVTTGVDVTFLDNSAADSCNDVYYQGADTVCQSELA